MDIAVVSDVLSSNMLVF